MRLITNSGGDRVVDELRRCLAPQGTLDVASGCFSLFAFAEVQDLVGRLGKCRLVLPAGEAIDLLLLGGPSDRAFRNRLLGRWLASQCAAWIESKVEVTSVPGGLPQSMLVVGDGDGSPTRVISGNCPFTTEGHARHAGRVPRHQPLRGCGAAGRLVGK